MDQESFVMQACDLMEDIIHANSTQQDLNAAIESLLDDSDDSDEAMDDLLLLSEVRKLTQIDDEAFLLEKLSLLFQQVRVSTTILRPYHQHFVTPDGCNHVTWSNFESKYPVGIFQRLFRFKQEHVAVLIRALEKNLKALLSPVATYFFLAMHLTNLHTILYGCEVAQYFNVDVEPLESYLRGFR
eukprot:GFUD01091112.1.p1 GENE.GFUD01091112.1~~GFUD01091112.1.p1  ORF type:complete len:185 (-),score=27.11 GFUD01091112.1:76-630(-)